MNISQINFINMYRQNSVKSLMQLLVQFKQSKRLIIGVFSALLLLTTISLTHAQALDPAFNPDANGIVRHFVIQEDGRILVSGEFTTIGGQTRNRIARLNADGTVDAAFNPNANGIVRQFVIQADGRILVGGEFTTIGGQTRNRIARLNADGTVDAAFNPNANGSVRQLAFQGSRILIGGFFTTVSGQTRNGIARLNADGTLDAAFNPNVGGVVCVLAIQADGRILIGGSFTTVGGQPRNNIARLNADGTVDAAFNPSVSGGGVNTFVYALAIQTDGRILISGFFTFVSGQTRNYVARLNADGTLDAAFNPDANDTVSALAIQPDGRILIGGFFTTVSGQTRNRIARLNADGTVDAAFNPNLNGFVDALAIQADGKIVVGGDFTTVGGQPRNNIARLNADPPSSIQFNALFYSTNEGQFGSTNFVVTVTRTGNTSATNSVNYQAIGGTATSGTNCSSGVDYFPAINSLTFNPGETARTFFIVVCGDTVSEPNETVNLSLSSPSNGANLGSPSNATLTIINDDGVQPTITISSVSQNEGSSPNPSPSPSPFPFTVNLSSATNQPVTVNYTTANGTATAGSDYVATNGTLTIPAGITSGTINVPVFPDTVVENNETFTVSLSNAINGTIAQGTATGTIINDDAAGSLQFATSAYNVNENGGSAAITVTRTNSTAGAVTVSYAVVNNTATGGASCTAGVDFINSSGTLNFASGATSQTFSVTVCNDSISESSETVNLILNSASNGATLGSPSAALLTIVDDDLPANCQPTPISFGQSINGNLSSGSCLVNSNRTDLYTFAGTAGQQIVISLDSLDNSGVNPLMNLVGVNGTTVLQGSSGGTNARIPASGFYTLPASGTYTIRASTFGGFGNYALGLSQQPASACNYTISAANTNVGPNGGTFFFDVLTGTGCPAVLANYNNENPWLRIISNIGGRVTFNASAYTGATDRSETITVAGITHTVRQTGIGAPSNDSFAQATLLPGISGFDEGRNFNATAEAGEPRHAENAAVRSVWYRWTAPSDGIFSFTTSGSDFDTVMAIYTGSSVGSLTRIAENDDATNFDQTSKVNFRATAGTVYYIAVDGKGGSTGSIRLGYTRFRRLFRLYLQTHNGVASPIMPTSVTALRQDGAGTLINANRVSLGVYEFDLPEDNFDYRVTIGAPEGIQWEPSSYEIKNSIFAFNELMRDGEPGNGQNQTANSAYTPSNEKKFTGLIRGLAPAEFAAVNIEIASMGSPSAPTPKLCSTPVSSNLLGLALYICKMQPNTTHQVIASAPGKSFVSSALPLAPTNAIATGPHNTPDFIITATTSPTLSISGSVLANGQGLSDATIVLSSGNLTARKPSDASGNYTFSDLVPNRTYTLKTTRNGFVFEDRSVTPSSSETAFNITAQTCDYTFSGTGTFTAAGAPGEFEVRATTSQRCEWTAAKDNSVDWITINSGNGIGNGRVQFSVQPNIGAARNGVIKVGGKDFTVQQAGNNNSVPIITGLSPSTKTAGDAAFELTITGSGFVSGAKVTVNNGAEKTPTSVSAIEIKVPITAADIAAAGTYPVRVINPMPGGGTSNPVNLTVNGCAYDITQPAQTTFTNAGGNSTFNVSTTPGCSWTATTSDYCMVSMTGSATGSGTVSFAVTGNPGVARTATISVVGRTVTINQTAAPGTHRTRLDFDGDGRADVSVYRPGSGVWYVLNAQNGFSATQFGTTTDKVAAADFDGDGKTDVAVFRPEIGYWYWLNSSNGAFNVRVFGQNGDIPVPADFDGDGKAELAVYRPGDGNWYVLNTVNNQFSAVQFGSSEDKPMVADYDGDGKADYAVFRPSNGTWYLMQSTRGLAFHQFGVSTDKVAPADYDGNGRTDIAVYRNGIWYILLNQTTLRAVDFGTAEDVPVAADYNGDKSADIAVYRPSTGIWYVWSCTNNAQLNAVQFGAATDKPISGN